MELEELKKVQRECAKKVIQEDDFGSIETIGGMDLTFEKLNENPTRAWASLVVIERKTLRPIYRHVVEDVVDFPYIPTFLAFRELPLLLKLYETAKVKADAYFIDGQGVAHPRGCGIASHFGVETGEVSVGVAKSRLFGHGDEPPPRRGAFTYLRHGNRVVGAIVRTRENTSPIYVSVGHRISLRTSIKLVLETSRYRVPEPTRLAHNLLQEVRRKKLRGLF
ncbi:MAG: endonuclease V [Aquificae bacterium]|nr:endonuclease V [Aquificota bacterium]